MPDKCWPTVYDHGPTFVQHRNMELTWTVASFLSSILWRYTCSRRNCGVKNTSLRFSVVRRTEMLTLRIWSGTSVSSCTFTMYTLCTGVGMMLARPTISRSYRPERKVRWSIASSRTVILLFSISSVTRRTNRRHVAFTSLIPSKTHRNKNMFYSNSIVKHIVYSTIARLALWYWLSQWW